jgi:hypothetical protein
MITKQAINITHADFTNAKVLSCEQLGVQVVDNTYLLNADINIYAFGEKVLTQIITCKSPFNFNSFSFIVRKVGMADGWWISSPYLTNFDSMAVWDTGIIYNKNWTKP